MGFEPSSAVVLPALIGLLVSFLIERLLQPATQAPWKRAPATLLLHCGVWLLVYCFELAVFRRPWFALAIVSSFFLFVVLVSNAKLHALREPFVYQDFEYFIDALRHPRLYFPFLGWARASIALVAFSAAFFAGIRFEPALTATLGDGRFVATVVALLAAVVCLLWAGARKHLPLGFAPVDDLWRLGMIASFWHYAAAERAPIVRAASIFDRPPEPASSGERPNLVVVQSESFFDARRLFSGIRPGVLREFDALKRSAICHGQVEVAAWGANTVRTEFAFLSGLPAERIGVHRFNPYRRLARTGIPTLASFLQGIGYRTVCVHPYPASFYDREVVHPALGFEEFIDIRQFAGVEKTGPYIGDLPLAEKVIGLLAASSDKPLFVHVITMENHGPLHLEKVAAGDAERLYSAPPPGCEDLTIYLRHLSNADRMAGLLRDHLAAQSAPSLLCWFGDHVPIMPKVYRALGEPPGLTDYFVWSSTRSGEESPPQDVKIENLALTLLQEMGLLRRPPTPAAASL